MKSTMFERAFTKALPLLSGNAAGASGIALHRSVGVQIAGNLFDHLLVEHG